MTGDGADPVLDEEPVGSRLAVRARRLLTRGPRDTAELPAPEEVAALPPDERHVVLEGLRVELYGLSSILAEAAVDRAFAAQDAYPPYGIVRSGHTDWRMVLAEPHPVEPGSITSFYELGKAYVDTMVFHLDAQFTELKASSGRWMVVRLEALLALFRTEAGPASKNRMRDGLSFIYGGLHFGTGVSVQLAEMMFRLLAPYDLPPAEVAAVVARSSRPAHRLAALSLDHVIVTYHAFLAPPELPGGPQWFNPHYFVVKEGGGVPESIDFRPDLLVAGKPHGARLDTITPTYATLGCPARVSPSSGVSPITRLWTWGVELAHATGLFGVDHG